MIVCVFKQPYHALILGMTEAQLSEVKSKRWVSLEPPETTRKNMIATLSGRLNFSESWSGIIAVGWMPTPREWAAVVLKKDVAFPIFGDEMVSGARRDDGVMTPIIAGLAFGLMICPDQSTLIKQFANWQASASHSEGFDLGTHPN